ncbi:MAG: porin family protein [Fulvivirga sp.]
MRKVLLSIVAVFAFAAASNAQSVGAKVGFNMANINGDSFDETDSKFNLIFGLYGEFMLSDKLGFQPELIFSGQGAKFDQADGSGGTIEFKQKLSYVNIPLLANIYLADNFYLQAGPYVGFLTNAEANVSGSLGILGGDNKDSFKSTDFGAMFGLGVKAGKFDFGLRYQLGLANIAEDFDDGSGNTVEGDAKNGVIQFGAGFRFVNN